MKVLPEKVLFFLLLLLFCAVTCQASDYLPVTVDAEGVASIVKGRKDAAREAALNNAFRRAVEQVVGVMVDSKTVVENSELLNDRIFSRSTGFVKTYKMTGESCEADTCRVSISATVSKVRLEKGLDDVGLLSKQLGKPRIAVIMTEQNVGNDGPSGSLEASSVSAGIAESVIHSVFEGKGYNLVDRETLVAIASREGKTTASGANISTEAALQVAAGGGAEVVIIGRAIAKAGASSISGTNMKTSQATVTARVVDADTGQLVASYSAKNTVAHVNPTAGGSEAIKNAAQELADNLNRQIVDKWSKKVGGTRMARITISGVSFKDISHIRELMKQKLAHVEETVERGFKRGTLTIDAEITCQTRELAEEISRTSLDRFRFAVVSYSGNTLKLKMLK